MGIEQIRDDNREFAAIVITEKEKEADFRYNNCRRLARAKQSHRF